MKEKGFTLIELLVVIAIIGVLSSVVLASLNDARTKSRDTKRLSDMKQMQIALDLYYLEHGTYPVTDGLGCGSWDVSGPEGSGTFINTLVNEGYLPSHLKDPTTNDTCGNYRYYRYGPQDGCPSRFYVLGVVNMETSTGRHPASLGWACTARNWQGEMEWVTGKLE